MLKRAFAVYRLELRLICLHWSYWVLQALWSAFVITSLGGYPYMTPRSMLLSTLPLSAIPFITIGILFLSALSASRARRNRFNTVEFSLPVGAEITLARLLALVTVAATLLIAPLGVAAASGAFAEFIAALPIFLQESLPVLALSSALVWLLASFLGIRRWMYPLFGLIWLGSAVLPRSLNAEVFPWLLLLSFTADAWNGYVYSAFWGRLALGSLPTFATVCYWGALLLLIAVVVWRIVRQRRYRNSPLALAAAAIGLAVMLIGGIGYSSEVQAANDQRAQIGMTARENYPAESVTLPADVAYVPTRYDLELDLSDFDQPIFSLQLEVANRGDAPLQDLTFTLNSQLEIVTVSIPYDRESDDLRLHLPDPLAPGASQTIDLTYRGALW